MTKSPIKSIQASTTTANTYTVPDPHWTPPGPGRYSEYKDGTNIFQSTSEILQESEKIARLRREAVRNAMKHAWNGYKTYAWGKDEITPQTAKGQDIWQGMGVTLVDTLDTLWLMGMKEEFWEARDWVRDELNNDIDHSVSLFETAIRSLGGLLSAYDWSGDKVFLEKAQDLGDRLLYGFDAPSGLAYNSVNLHTHDHENNRWSSPRSLVAETASCQVEYR